MARLLDQIPGYWEAVSRETVGRDAAYLRSPVLVAGVILRPLTLRDYLRLSAESSPFIAGGKPGKDDCCFLLFHQQSAPQEGVDPQKFAVCFDAVDVEILVASCASYISQALADAPGSGGPRKASYYSLGAMLVTAFRSAYPGISKTEVLDTPLEELFQEYRAMHPSAVMFNPSDRLKSWYLRNLQA